MLFNVYHPGRVLVGADSEFQKKSRAQKKEERRKKKAAKEESIPMRTYAADV